MSIVITSQATSHAQAAPRLANRGTSNRFKPKLMATPKAKMGSNHLVADPRKRPVAEGYCRTVTACTRSNQGMTARLAEYCLVAKTNRRTGEKRENTRAIDSERTSR